MTTTTSIPNALLSGAAGAVALTSVHQVARAITPDAPRMDIVGMRALTRGLRASGREPHDQNRLYLATLAGDLIGNSAYYSLATTYTRGAVLGVLAGIGALLLPEPMGLGSPARSERVPNRVMTVAWYLTGGLVAAAVAQRLARRSRGISESRSRWTS